MAESLESHVGNLKSRLEGLKQLHANTERPVAVDLEIQILQEQIKHLIGSAEHGRMH